MAQLLVNKGWDNVQVVLGGWAAWQSSDLPIELPGGNLHSHDPFTIELPTPED